MEITSTKWTTTAASIWIQSAAGASYTFSIYSSTLKSTQSYSQSTLDSFSVFKDIGANAGVLSGLLFSAVTQHRCRHRRWSGPWIVHLAGAVQCFVGYLFIWAAVVGVIAPPPVGVMCFFMLVAAHAQTFFNTANVVSGLRNFGDYGGTIVGIMKGFLGLSGAVLIQFYYTVCEGNPSTFILLLALTPTAIVLLLMGFVRIYDSSSKEDKKHLNAFSAVSLLIVAYLFVVIILENIFTFPVWAHTFTFSILLVLLASPLGVAIRAHREESDRYARALLEERGQKPEFSAEHDPTAYQELPENDIQQEMPAQEVNMSLLQALCSVNFWLIFVAMVCGLGSGVATINNMSQIGESQGYTVIETNSLVSLWSIWNFLGRFGAGYVSDIFLHKDGWARPLFMAITLATMTIGHIIIASGFSKSLYLGSILVGISYGSQWSLMPTITSELFGVVHMGTIFNTIAIASPLGSYIFSVRIIGYIYDQVATGDDETCSGTRCFMLSYLIIAAVVFFGFLVALVLFFRTRRFYRVVVLRRLRHS